MNNDKKTPPSQLRWQKEYDKNNMKLTGIKHSIEERLKWEMAAEKNGMKLASFVRSCVKYCIDNDIDLNNQE